jgi:hypothetical protein
MNNAIGAASTAIQLSQSIPNYDLFITVFLYSIGWLIFQRMAIFFPK